MSLKNEPASQVANMFFFFFTLVTGPRRSLSLKCEPASQVANMFFLPTALFNGADVTWKVLPSYDVGP